MELKENLCGHWITWACPPRTWKRASPFTRASALSVALRTAVPDGGKVAFLRLGNVLVETYESNEATGKPGAIDHLALKARDIEAAFKAVKALGYEMVNDEIEFLPFWENGVRFFTFYGPNREKIEFSQMQ